MKTIRNKKELDLAIAEARLKIQFHEEKIEETAILTRDALYENMAFKTAGVIGKIVGGIVSHKSGGGKMGKTLMALSALLPVLIRWFSKNEKN